jgi:PEGA domain
MPRPGFAGVLTLVFVLAGASAATAMPQHVRSGDGLAAGEDAAPRGDVGYLTVTTDPTAKLEIDGVDTGKTTPVTKLPLGVGKHKVTVTSLDGKTKRTLGVTIVAGEEKRLTVTL